MFYLKETDQTSGGAVSANPAPDALEPPPVPLERLEAQLCDVAGHLAAATCQFLVLLAEFAAARLSYAKVRALTRIATPETEEQLAVMADLAVQGRRLPVRQLPAPAAARSGAVEGAARGGY